MNYPTTNAVFKRTPEWFSLPETVRCFHDDLERAAGFLENFGRFADARHYPEGHWKFLAGFTMQAVTELVRYRLVRWEGDDLVVEHYDAVGLQRQIDGRASNRKRIEDYWARVREGKAKPPNHRSDQRSDQESDQGSDLSRANHAKSFKRGYSAEYTPVNTAVDSPSVRPSGTRSRSGSEGKGEAGPPPPSSSSNQGRRRSEASAGGGGPPFGWIEVATVLPNWTAGWERDAVPAFEALELQTKAQIDELVAWIKREARTPRAIKSPPTPLRLFAQYAKRPRVRAAPPVVQMTQPQRPRGSRDPEAAGEVLEQLAGKLGFPSAEELERDGVKAGKKYFNGKGAQ